MNEKTKHFHPALLMRDRINGTESHCGNCKHMHDGDDWCAKHVLDPYPMSVMQYTQGCELHEHEQ